MTGSALATRAKAQGDSSLALTRSELDIADDAAVSRCVREFRPDVVINAAAYTAVDRAESERDRAAQVNTAGAGNLARAAREASAAIVHVSTDYVFDGEASTPYKPDEPTNPRSVYGQTKLSGELEVRAANENHCIVRTSWVFSENGTNFVQTMLRLGRERSQLRVVNDQIGRPTYAGDLADALLTVADRLYRSLVSRGTYHFANSGATTWFDFACSIFDMISNTPPTVLPISSGKYPTAAPRPRYSVLDTSSFTEEFGIDPRPWQEPLAEVLKAH
jgi:dTDP-4-dehydrorhamnose reductase